MKRLIFITAACCIVLNSADLGAQTTSLDSEKEFGDRFLQTHYSDVLILKSLISTGIIDVGQYGLIGYNHDNIGGYNDYLKEFLRKNPSFLNRILSTKREYSDRIQVWCDAYIFTSYPKTLHSSVFLEELLYNTRETKHIIRSFLNHEAQDWGSLSSSQSWLLPYKFADYMISLKAKERIYVYKKLIDGVVRQLED